MAPDAFKLRDLSVPYRTQLEDAKSNVAADSESLECVLQPRRLTNFSYIEQPIKCYLSLGGKRLACNGKSACFMVPESSKDALDEFLLLPQTDGSVVFQNAKTQQFLCSASNGKVYAPHTCHADLEKWTMTQTTGDPRFHSIGSYVHPDRSLVCRGNTVETSENAMEWKIDLLSGEICFLRHPTSNQQVQCDLLGNLTMIKAFPGWAGWRFSEAGDGNVRISPWAHSNFYLSSDEGGTVSVTEERGVSELWSVERAPNGLEGVLIKSVRSGRVLHYNLQLDEFLTVPGAALHLDESCVWDLQSLHRKTYYLVTSDGSRRLEASKKGLVRTRGMPGRLSSEEWTIIPTNNHGIVTLFSESLQKYLGSNELGEVILLTSLDGCTEEWVLEEREEGFVVRSEATGRVLVSQNKGPICTVEPGTIVYGNTRWKLEPKIPPQISKDKVKKFGTAVAIGVAGTVATPFLIGGAIGALGIAHVGVAGEVAIGGIRAVEAINTITRVTMSSSQLMISQTSSLSSKAEQGIDNTVKGNRPFSAWRSW